MKVNVKLTRLTFSRSPEAGGQPQRERLSPLVTVAGHSFFPPGTPEKAPVDPYHPCQINGTKGFVGLSNRTGTDGNRTGTDGESKVQRPKANLTAENAWIAETEQDRYSR